MVDPIGLSIGLIGLVATAWHTARRVNEFVESIEGAPKAISALSKEVNSLTAILSNLRELMAREEQAKNPNQLRFVRLLEIPLENCTRVLHEIQIFLQPFVKSDSRWKAFAWRFKQSGLQTLQNLLIAYKGSLEIAITTITL